MKFIHAADLHLDSPLAGLERYEGVPAEEVRGATRRALESLVELAIDNEVAFVLIAGDVYDGDWPDYNTGLFFAQQMSRLREAGVRVFVVSGNHDAQSRITKMLRLPANVTLMSAVSPQSVELEDYGVVIHGQSFATRAVTEDLSVEYPDARPGFFNIGLLHTSLNGRAGHEPYAPCSLAGLLSKGYDYWALGHIHCREIVHQEPWVVFSGNTQGRHARETGPKGCTLVTVSEGEVVSVEHHDLDVVRWQVLEVDAAGADTACELVDRVADALDDALSPLGDQLLAVRLRINGACAAHKELILAPDHWRSEIRARLIDIGAGRVWLEKIELSTVAERDLETMAARDDALGGLLRAITDLEADEGLPAEIGDLFADLVGKIPGELRQGEEPLVVDDPATLRAALDDVKDLLVARLLGAGASE